MSIQLKNIDMLGFAGTERKGADKIMYTYFDFLTLFLRYV